MRSSLPLIITPFTLGTLVVAMASQLSPSITLRIGETAYYMHQVPEVSGDRDRDYNKALSLVEWLNNYLTLARRSYRCQPNRRSLHCIHNPRFGDHETGAKREHRKIRSVGRCLVTRFLAKCRLAVPTIIPRIPQRGGRNSTAVV